MKVFVEEQKFDQWWFRLLLLAVAGIMIGTIVTAYPELKENPTEFWTTISVVGFSFILILFLAFFIKLETKIDEQGIHYGFWPIQLRLKLVPWNVVEKCFIRKYNPLADYGGWGFKVVSIRKKGRALNVKGNIGIQLVFKNGKKLLIGTQKEDEAKKVLETYRHKVKL